MKINFDHLEIADYLEDYLQLPEIVEAIEDLKDEFDWNPFDEDEDEFDGVFEEVKHNWDLVWSVVVNVCVALERIVIGGVALTDQEKHKAAKEALDRAIRLPFWAEPFDGVLIDLLINAAVSYLNRVDWDGETDDEDEIEDKIAIYATRRGKEEVEE